MGDFDGTGFLGKIGGILGGIAGFLKGFFNITTKELLRLVQYLRDQLVTLSKQLLSAIWSAGRALARALVSIARLAGHALKSFVLWVDEQLTALHTWLQTHFAGVLRFLKRIKDDIDHFYRTFVKPIIDTIEFVRQINRVLQLFHVNVLQKLDMTLAQLEQRLEEPILWLRGRVVTLENWVNRIVDGDGLFTKITLLKSLSKYAPAWINGFWNTQIDRGVQAGTARSRTRIFPIDGAGGNGLELGKLYRGEPNMFQGQVDELVGLWQNEMTSGRQLEADA